MSRTPCVKEATANPPTRVRREITPQRQEPARLPVCEARRQHAEHLQGRFFAPSCITTSRVLDRGSRIHQQQNRTSSRTGYSAPVREAQHQEEAALDRASRTARVPVRNQILSRDAPHRRNQTPREQVIGAEIEPRQTRPHWFRTEAPASWTNSPRYHAPRSGPRSVLPRTPDAGHRKPHPYLPIGQSGPQGRDVDQRFPWPQLGHSPLLMQTSTAPRRAITNH